MAGGKLGFDPKKQFAIKSSQSSEVLKDSQGTYAPKETPKFSLKGVLGLNQSVEINKSAQKVESWGKEFLFNVNYLQKEQDQLRLEQEKELQKEINELRTEIQKLIKATDNLDKQVEKVAFDPIVEVNEYEVTFLKRIKTFIANFRRNVEQASIWLESFQSRKKKKNSFWGKVKDKKTGGEQYLFSNEHSVSRIGS